MIRISKKAFDVYVNFLRSDQIFMISNEVAWYTNTENTLFAVILLDHTDQDFNPVFMKRDLNRKVKFLDNTISLSTFEKAEKWVNDTEKKVDNGVIMLKDDDNIVGVDLFEIVVPELKLHPYFKAVNDLPARSGAKKLISEITPHFIDIDGNYVQQFQTSGFNSRLWELYLFCYFKEEGLSINREYNAPDFIVSDGKTSIAVEAAIVDSKTPYKEIDVRKLPSAIDVLKETENRFPLNYGNQLYTKLSHRTKGSDVHYWQYEHTKGLPFVIGIADFHDVYAMSISTTALINYLYGVKHSHYYKDDGELVVVTEEIAPYTKESTGTKIPAGFFFYPEAENVSAIIHSASGTLSKFDRIGKQCGFDTNDTTIHRIVTAYNPAPNASIPLVFEYNVDESCEETWAEGIAVYHNPNATIPVPKDFLPSATHNYFINGKIVTENVQNHVYSSITFLTSKKHEK